MSIKFVYIHECPMLNHSNDQAKIQTSNKGLSFIDSWKKKEVREIFKNLVML